MQENAMTAVDLTKNQSLVMNALSQAKEPLSAYTILDELREHGFRAPPQVYRALEKLVEIGLVHRLESLNAFVACQHPTCSDKSEGTVLFVICQKCGNVQELVKSKLSKTISGLAKELDFVPNKSTLELRGVCSTCQEN